MRTVLMLPLCFSKLSYMVHWGDGEADIDIVEPLRPVQMIHKYEKKGKYTITARLCAALIKCSAPVMGVVNVF